MLVIEAAGSTNSLRDWSNIVAYGEMYMRCAASYNMHARGIASNPKQSRGKESLIPTSCSRYGPCLVSLAREYETLFSLRLPQRLHLDRNVLRFFEQSSCSISYVLKLFHFLPYEKQTIKRIILALSAKTYTRKKRYNIQHFHIS